MKRKSIGLISAAILAGCASTGDYACPAPDGVTCMPAKDVYTSSLQRRPSAAGIQRSRSEAKSDAPVPRLAAQSRGAMVLDGATLRFSAAVLSEQSPQMLPASAPNRGSSDSHLRVWVAAWTDASGNVHESSVVHTPLEP